MTHHRIVLTGGPCGGKTTAITRIAERLESLGFRVFMVPETPTMLFQGGFTLHDVDASQIVQLETVLLEMNALPENALTAYRAAVFGVEPASREAVMTVAITYTLYVILTIGLTIWVARTLHGNGRVFLIDAFHGNVEMAASKLDGGTRKRSEKLVFKLMFLGIDRLAKQELDPIKLLNLLGWWSDDDVRKVFGKLTKRVIRALEKGRSLDLISRPDERKGTAIYIDSCRSCVDRDEQPDYGADSFDRDVRWECTHPIVTKTGGSRNITRHHSWQDGPPDIPSWCPRRVK